MGDNPTDASEAFDQELGGLIDKYRSEWSISYAAIVGILSHHQGKLLAEWRDEEEPPTETWYRHG